MSLAEEQFEDELETKEQKLIIVTGFGPFKGHEEVNASWEAVRLLPDALDFCDESYRIEKVLVPVLYAEVDRIVEDIWSKEPYLVIHCGVHGGIESIHVEEVAPNGCYVKKDYDGKKLSSPFVGLENSSDECQQICTEFSVNDIVCEVNNGTIQCSGALKPSTEIGNYLCAYIYLRSLDKDRGRSLFVHVPPVDKPFSSPETSEALFNILKVCVAQLQNRECGCDDGRSD